MPDLSTLALFAAASLAILVIPGPAVLFIVTRSVQGGRRAGLISMLGVEAGGFVHVLAATAGLSALLASSAATFAVVKYAGAAYLIWLGLTHLRKRGAAPAAPRPAPTHARLFREGVIVNVLNPKVTIFFLAFLPQFADGATEMLVLGVLYTLIAIVSDGAYALLAGTLGARLRGRFDEVAGGIYILLGGLAAAEG